MVRSPQALRCSKEQNALHTLIHQRHLTPSCGGHAPTAERTLNPARMFTESLTPGPELENSEGMSGTAVVLGGDQSPHSTYIQVAGKGQQISTGELRKAMKASASLHMLLLKFVQVFMVQTAHTAIANARAHIDQRLARWILMAHDRTRDDTLPLTHEFLALMLGVRRAGVTEAVQSLKRQKLIGGHRNQIVVLSRKGIERAAGNSYGTPEKEYRRLIG